MYIWSSPALKPKLFTPSPSVPRAPVFLYRALPRTVLCRAIYTKLVAIWLATIGRRYYWSHTSARSVRLYTGECVVDSSTGLWDRAPWPLLFWGVYQPLVPGPFQGWVGGGYPLVLSLVLSKVLFQVLSGEGGTPARIGQGVPARQDRGTPQQKSKWCYAAGDTPLAVTQQDFLVSTNDHCMIDRSFSLWSKPKPIRTTQHQVTEYWSISWVERNFQWIQHELGSI